VPRKAATPGTKAATSAQPVTLRAETLARFIERMFIAAGCSAREATQIANCLVRANLYGHDSHGVQMAPIYVDNLAHGLVRAGQTPRVVADHGAIVGLDGQKGFGQAIGEDAMRIAIERASALGCCVLGLSNTHHLGRIGQWAEQCAHAGFASVHFVNALSTPLVAPWGGGDARLSTDPFCVGVPREPEPLILDYATSKVALGKVRVAQDKGARMAPDVLLDAAGRPTDDPATMFADPGGALLSFGEHKGFALAVMCEVLGGALSGGSVQHMRPEVSPMINNMLSLVFAPGKLVSHADLARQVDALAAWLKASPPRAGGTGIHLPGEPERLTAREREERGIPLPKRTCDALVAAARGLGMAGKELAFLKSSAS
jgi:hydroxycarboxylate dehydrogenase B